MIKEVRFNDELYGIIISGHDVEDGITFFTPVELSQQLACMKHPRGKVIKPHIHNAVSRQVTYTQEVLILKSGKLRVDFYDNNKNYLESHILVKDDIILLVAGGHGFEVLEDLEMIEVKQGPYTGDSDKTQFEVPVLQELKIVN